MIKCLGAFQNALGALNVQKRHYICHLATCAPRSPWPRRMAPSVRPGGRPSGGDRCVQKWFRHWPNRVLSCSGCSKRSTHTRRSAFGQWRRLQPDGQSGLSSRLSSTAPGHVSATQRMTQRRSDRPCNRCGRGCLLAPSTGTEHLRLALCHQWCRTRDLPTHFLDF